MKKILKGQSKGFLAGTLTATLIGASILTLQAQTVTRQLSFGVNLNVDGQLLQLPQEDQPFLMDGRTFLPVRAIAEALGTPIDWNGQTSTVYIGQIPHIVQNISEYGRQVAEDFLMQFPTIFANSNYRDWEPDVFLQVISGFSERTGFYDRYGNIIDAPWLLNYALYASGFSLWDFDNTGIPDIKIYYADGHLEGSGDGGTPASLFRFINGEYRRVYSPVAWSDGLNPSWPSGFSPTYFRDNDGNLIFYTTYTDSMSFYYINFDGSVAIFEPIASTEPIGFQGENWVWGWNNRITGQQGIPLGNEFSEWGNVSGIRSIPGMNVSLTQIDPLNSLQEELTTSVSRRLQDEGVLINNRENIDWSLVIPTLNRN